MSAMHCEAAITPSNQLEDSVSTLSTADIPCGYCGFILWEPIARTGTSKLGLYNDSRFPGRSILSLHDHFDSLSDIPMTMIISFVRDLQVAMDAIREVTGAARVNVAILGNRDSHVHAHLVPRFPDVEEFPDCSPWNDQRPKVKIPEGQAETLRTKISRHFLEFGQTADSGSSNSNSNLLAQF